MFLVHPLRAFPLARALAGTLSKRSLATAPSKSKKTTRAVQEQSGFGDDGLDSLPRSTQSGADDSVTKTDSVHPVIAEGKKLERQSKSSILEDAAEKVKTDAAEAGSFDKFLISEATQSRLQNLGITSLFPIQARTFDLIYKGEDVLGKARTGTGKTMAFLLPIVEKLLKDESAMAENKNKVIVLTPTRELAKQIFNELGRIAPRFTKVCIYGGTNYTPQENGLRDGVDFIIACPGRLNDLISRGIADFSSVQCVILDEADVMMNMGFQEQTELIMDEVQKQKSTSKKNNVQTLLFSATMPDWVQKIVKKYLSKTYKTVDLIGEQTMQTSVEITHYAARLERNTLGVLRDIILVHGGAGRSIIFVDTKDESTKILNGLSLQGCGMLNGDMSQVQRDNTITQFRNGSVRCLIATDVASRGLDIPEVDLVICMRPPSQLEPYVHRSGRTGRAGRKGVSVILETESTHPLTLRLARNGGFKLSRFDLPTPEKVAEAQVKVFESRIDVQRPKHSRYEAVTSCAKKIIHDAGSEINAVAALVLFLNEPYSFEMDEQKMILDETLKFALGEISRISSTYKLEMYHKHAEDVLERHKAIDVISAALIFFHKRHGTDRESSRGSGWDQRRSGGFGDRDRFNDRRGGWDRGYGNGSSSSRGFGAPSRGGSYGRDSRDSRDRDGGRRFSSSDRNFDGQRSRGFSR